MEKSCDYDMSNNNATSSSHALPTHITILLSLTCLLIIRLVGMEVKGTNLSLLVIIVVLLVILTLTAFKCALKSHGLKSMYLGIMSLVLEIRSIIYVIK
jgi:hypothetical protein